MDTNLDEIALHFVGNKTVDHLLKLSNDLLNIDDELAELISTSFFNRFTNSFDEYSFTHASSLEFNEIYTFAKQIFENNDLLHQNSQKIAQELQIRTQQVNATIELIDEGSTIPFIARYRKEVTGALDDIQLRTLEDRLRYLRELEARRITVVKSIDEQGKLTDALSQHIQAAETKGELEDLYLPFKTKRRTKGQIAIEAGLEPLALALYEQPTLTPENHAKTFINADKNIEDVESALNGAKFILMERFSEDAKLLSQLKLFLWQYGDIHSTVIEAERQKADKFQDYFDYQEAIAKIPSHRALALFRSGFFFLAGEVKATITFPPSES